MSKSFKVECSCSMIVRDPSRYVSPPGWLGLTHHPDNFLTEESAIQGWEFHKKQMRLEFPNSRLLPICNSARMIITETKKLGE